MEKLLLTKDIENLFSISRMTIYRWTKKGYLKPVRIGKLNYYQKEDVENLIKGNRKEQ